MNKRQRLEPRTEIIALEGRRATLLSIPYSDCIKRFSTFLDASTGLRNNNIQPNKNDPGNAKVRRLFLPKPVCVSWCCRKGVPFQGPKLGSCLTLRNELSEEKHAEKARDFIGKGRPGGEQEGEGAQEKRFATWLAVSGFMVMGLVSGLSLAHHSDSESFLVVHALFSQAGCQREGFREVVGHVVSLFDLS